MTSRQSSIALAVQPFKPFCAFLRLRRSKQSAALQGRYKRFGNGKLEFRRFDRFDRFIFTYIVLKLQPQHLFPSLNNMMQRRAILFFQAFI